MFQDRQTDRQNRRCFTCSSTDSTVIHTWICRYRPGCRDSSLINSQMNNYQVAITPCVHWVSQSDIWSMNVVLASLSNRNTTHLSSRCPHCIGFDKVSALMVVHLPAAPCRSHHSRSPVSISFVIYSVSTDLLCFLLFCSSSNYILTPSQRWLTNTTSNLLPVKISGPLTVQPPPLRLFFPCTNVSRNRGRETKQGVQRGLGGGET